MVKKLKINENTINEARPLHTWNISYTDRMGKNKIHIVDAPDAYEANRKARRELHITPDAIDDTYMIENEDITESYENAYGTDKYRLVDYFDVWGNEEDGYEVNDLAIIADDITIADDATEQDILDFLYNMKYLNTNDLSKINVEMFDPDMIELFDANTEYPICRLERIY